jgi:hypothetical protein
MNAVVSTPNRLYKYRTFNDKTVDMLVMDELYFADPSTFNDPLDTKPSIETDICADKLEIILRKLVEQRLENELKAAANVLRSGGQRTADHIRALNQKIVEGIVAGINYNATNPDYGCDDSRQFLLGQEVGFELLRRYNKGVVSFSKSAISPLMWSHYADQHNGICIGYSIPSDITPISLHKVKYGGSRVIEASKIEAMMNGDQSASQNVNEAVLARKAEDWRYEKEWRLIGPRGAQRSPVELREITFGMRCKTAVRFTIIQALKARNRSVRYFEIREQPDTFKLIKSEMDIEEFCSGLPIRALDIHQDFAGAVTIP